MTSLRAHKVALVATLTLLIIHSGSTLFARGGGGGGGPGPAGGGGGTGGGARGGGPGPRGAPAARGYAPGGRGYYARGPYPGRYWGGYRGYGWRGPAYGVGIGFYGSYGYPGWGYAYPPYAYADPAYAYYETVPAGTVVYPAAPVGAISTVPDPGARASAISNDLATRALPTGPFIAQGETAFRASDYTRAVSAFRHAMVDNPEDAETALLLGQALFATGQFDEAAGATQGALEILPQDRWGAVIQRYRQLYGKPQDYTAQLRALERALRDKPDEPSLHFLAGYHYAYLGFTAQAVEQFDGLLKLAPNDQIARKLREAMQAKLSPPQPVAPPTTTRPISKEGPALPGVQDSP